ncbi:MAG: aspartate dehydrogenase [Parvibaculaceae bacterium]
MRSRQLRICLVGWGAVARRMVDILGADDPRSIRIVAVAVRDSLKPRHPIPEGSRLIGSPEALRDMDVDMVIEAADRTAVEPWASVGLRHAEAVAISSTSALGDDLALARLLGIARECGSQLVIPAGALGGLGVLSAASALPLHDVTHAISKPPAAWRGTRAEELVDLGRLTSAVTFFTGTARTAAAQFPQNANVAVISALAGVGLDRTRLDLIADPGLGRNMHRVSASGAFGRLDFQVENEPLPGNPKSSEMTALSLARLARNRVAPLVH